MRGAAAAIALVLVACGSSGDALDGVHYELGASGYARVERSSTNEHVWAPSDPAAPMIALRVQATPHGDEPAHCTPSGGVGTGTGIFVGRDGEMRTGRAVMISLCSSERPDRTVMCSVYRDDGTTERLSRADEDAFAAICRGIALR